jgi:uncharacterized protein YkwD
MSILFGRVRSVSSLLVLAAFAVGAAGAPAADPDAAVLEKVNAARTAAGLAPAVLDPALSKGCLAHARYLAQNFEQMSKQGQATNDELPAMPGFSEEGKAAARAAFSGFDRRDPADLVDQWLATVFIRPLLLDPDLKRIGWGQAGDKRKGWFGVIDVSRGKGGTAVVIYPADGQKDVPLAYPGTELPDPIPQATQKRAGYPVTFTFPRDAAVEDVTAHLSTAAGGKGEDVAAWVSTPEKPAQDRGYQRNTVCLIAKEPLQAETTYTVSVKARVGGRAWNYEGKFTTAKETARRPEEGPADRDALAKAIVEQVNGYRKQAGLDAVALDAGLTKGCRAHADYLVRNAGNPATEGLGGHDEDPKLPGYSEEGQRAGKASDIAFDVDPLAAVPDWMATLFHRVPLLDPELARVGFGATRGEKSGWVVVLDVTSGRGSGAVVFYPADGQKDVPLAYHAGERPDPIPQSKDHRAGFPITVMFPRGAAVKEATARLVDGRGQEVAAWVSTPEQTVDRDLQRNQVCLIARQPLQPGTQYTVTVTAQVDGTEWKQKCSFTTRKGQ